MIWTTLVLSVLFVGFEIFCYVGNCICIRDEMAAYHFLPGDIVPQIREHGVKKFYLRYYKKMTEEQYEAIAKKQFLEEYDEISLRPEPRGFWGKVFHSLKFELFLYKSKKKGYL